MKPITIHTEDINTYGFWILTDGINTARFKKNPVLFYNHYTWSMPIGKWEELKIEQGNITAAPKFDTNDEQGKIVGRKFEDGYLNAASIGIRIIETSDDPRHLKPGQTRPTVTKCELIEVSVVAIPANAQATVVLCDESGQAITNLNIDDIFKPLSIKEMTPDITQLQLKIQQLEADKQQLEQEKQQQAVAAKKQNAETLVDAAIGSNKILASLRDSYVRLATQDYEAIKVIIDSAKPYKPVSEQLKQGSYPAKTDADLYDKLDKEGGLAKLKAENPTEFERLLEAKKEAVKASGKFSE